MDWLRANSQYVINSVRATVLAMIGFHVVTMTQEQIGLLIAALESIFAMITAKTTVNSERIDTIVEKRLADRAPMILLIIGLGLAASGCASTFGRLPADTSVEAKIAVRGDQVVQALRQVLPTLKPYVCRSEMPQGALCVKPADADRIAENLILVFTTAESLGKALQAVDEARTAGEREVGMARVREYVRSPSKRASCAPRSFPAMSRLA